MGHADRGFPLRVAPHGWRDALSVTAWPPLTSGTVTVNTTVERYVFVEVRTVVEVARASRTCTSPPALARAWYFLGRGVELASLRRIVAQESRRLGLAGDVVDRIVLALNEIATNAAVYGPYELRMYTDPAAWGVADCCADGASTVAAHLAGDQETPSLDEDGRGLLVVGALFPGHQVLPAHVPPNLAGKEVRLTLETPMLGVERT